MAMAGLHHTNKRMALCVVGMMVDTTYRSSVRMPLLPRSSGDTIGLDRLFVNVNGPAATNQAG